jgi:hypothetical protein
MKDLREAINATIQGCSHYSLRGDPSLRQPPFRMTDKDVRLVHEYRRPAEPSFVISSAAREIPRRSCSTPTPHAVPPRWGFLARRPEPADGRGNDNRKTPHPWNSKWCATGNRQSAKLTHYPHGREDGSPPSISTLIGLKRRSFGEDRDAARGENRAYN